MRGRRRPSASATPPDGAKKLMRCAIYTRVSSDGGLDQDFNSLQAQREACEAYGCSATSWMINRDNQDDNFRSLYFDDCRGATTKQVVSRSVCRGATIRPRL